jgi:hypothetical protein
MWSFQLLVAMIASDPIFVIARLGPAIQYPKPLILATGRTGYWIPAFAGMTMELWPGANAELKF